VLRLDEIRSRRVGELSKGQRKRAMLAIALAAGRRVTLLDEPFDGLDLRHAREVSDYFRRSVAETGHTLVLSIHSMHDAEKLCDRFVLLNEGMVVAEGTLGELRGRAGIGEAPLEDVFLALTA
jgi:ABC-2 type transport system ATP-binding protein